MIESICAAEAMIYLRSLQEQGHTITTKTIDWISNHCVTGFSQPSLVSYAIYLINVKNLNGFLDVAGYQFFCYL